MLVLHDEFRIDPEVALRMPFRRFLAFQRLAFKRSVERRNADLARERAAGGVADEV